MNSESNEIGCLAADAVCDCLAGGDVDDVVRYIEDCVSSGLDSLVEIQFSNEGIIVEIKPLGLTDRVLYDREILSAYGSGRQSEFCELVNKLFWSMILRIEMTLLEKRMSGKIDIQGLLNLDRYSYEWN